MNGRRHPTRASADADTKRKPDGDAGQQAARLRGELQHAYSAWLSASERGDDTARFPIDTSGCAQHNKVRWFDYLAAKERLVAAYAEQRR